jgi:hypothetical protein
MYTGKGGFVALAFADAKITSLLSGIGKDSTRRHEA